MSIYIKGLNMPEGQHTITITICHDGYAVVEFRDQDDYPDKIEGYQVVPVLTPHGRLKDIDALETDTEYDLYLDDFTSYTKEQIDLAPTVIEAECDE